MTRTEAAVLAAVRSRGQLSTTMLIRQLGRPTWRIKRATRSLHRQGLIVQGSNLRWRMYCTASAR